VAYND